MHALRPPQPRCLVFGARHRDSLDPHRSLLSWFSRPRCPSATYKKLNYLSQAFGPDAAAYNGDSITTLDLVRSAGEAAGFREELWKNFVMGHAQRLNLV